MWENDNDVTIYQHDVVLKLVTLNYFESFRYFEYFRWIYCRTTGLNIFYIVCLSFTQNLFFFFPPALHIIEWKGSCKELLFCSAVSFLFKSDNISRATYRGGALINDITKIFDNYPKIPPFVPELFVYSHMSNGSLL